MAKFQFVKGEASIILKVFIQDSTSTSGAGLGSLDESSNIVGGYVKRNGTGVALAVDEDVDTEGTYEAPSSAAQVRIGTPANMRTGVYELHFHDDLFTTADYVMISLGGASNMADLMIEIQLTDFDLNTSIPIIVGLVWDEILIGATHNISTSSGRRLRQLQESAAVYGGFIWIDTTANGAAGTTDYENGTSDNPVDNIDDANTLAGSVGISRFQVAPGSSITFAASQTDQVFMGSSWTLALGGRDIDGSTFIGASVSGTATNTTGLQYFISCNMGACTLPEDTHVIDGAITGTQTIGEAGDFFYDNCHSAIAGTATPAFDFGGALNSSNLNFRHYSGGIEIQNMGAGTGTYTMSLEGNGQLVINANCSATSSVAIRGNFTVTDNASGAVTLSDNARFDVLNALPAMIRDAVDTTISDAEFIISSSAASTDDAYNGAIIIMTPVAAPANKQVDTVLDYAGGTQTITLKGTFTLPSPSVGDRIDIIPQRLSAEGLATDTFTNDSIATGAITAAEASVNISQIGGVAASAVKLAASAGTIVIGTVDTDVFGSTTTQFEADDITTAAADHFIGRTIIFTSGTLSAQAAEITDYSLEGGSGRFTVNALTSAPANNVTFVVV